MPLLWWSGDVLGPPPQTKIYNVWSAYDIDGEIVKYEFDLDGDGGYETSGMQTEVSHTYTEHDTVTVRCRGTNNESGVTVQEAEIVIDDATTAGGWKVHAIEDFGRG